MTTKFVRATEPFLNSTCDMGLLPSGGKQHDVLQFGSIQEGILQARHCRVKQKKSTQNWYSWVVKIRNTSKIDMKIAKILTKDMGIS